MKITNTIKSLLKTHQIVSFSIDTRPMSSRLDGLVELEENTFNINFMQRPTSQIDNDREARELKTALKIQDIQSASISEDCKSTSVSVTLFGPPIYCKGEIK